MARAPSQSTPKDLARLRQSENDGVGGKVSASFLLQHKQAFHLCCFPLFSAVCALEDSSYREVAFCTDLAPIFSMCAVEEFCASTFPLNVLVFPRSFTDLLSEYENISRAMCLTQNTVVVMAKKASFFFHTYPILRSVSIETHSLAGRGFVLLKETAINVQSHLYVCVWYGVNVTLFYFGECYISHKNIQIKEEGFLKCITKWDNVFLQCCNN